MSFDLDSGMFFNEGEPYEWGEWSDKPTSLWQAITSMDHDEKECFCEEHFGRTPTLVSCEEIFNAAVSTNACDQLHYPIRVYLDTTGYHWVTLYGDPK